MNRVLGALFFLFAYFLSLPAVLSPAEQLKEQQGVVDGLQKSYESVIDFVADFRQETEIKTLNRNIKAWGKVYFKRPGKMFWRYEEPKDQWVLADGKSLYYYQPEEKQVLKSPIKNAFRSDVPLSFLLGIGNLKKDFRTVLKGQEQGDYVLQLSPKEEIGGVGEIFLGVEPRSFDIHWARIRDAAGNVTTVRFSNMRKGTGLKDSLFLFKLPEGADLIELGS
jgi:outer membrane lipoprotein carrier protein